MIKALNRLTAWQKTSFAMLYDASMIVICFYLSIALRHEQIYPKNIIESTPFIYSLLISLVLQFTVFVKFNFYKGIWRYSSTHDLIRILKGISFSTLLNFLVLFLMFRLEGIPRSSIFINWTLLIITLGGGRFTYRVLRDKLAQQNSNTHCSNVLIIGAGSAGEQLCREIYRNPDLNLKVIGFLDDDKTKQKKLLHGIPVLGKLESIKILVHHHKIDQIFIAIPSATSQEIKTIFDTCHGTGISVKTLPKMSDIIKGNVEISQLRNINLEDLVGRKEIFLNQESISSMTNGKKILISGAGGSIGSELVKQVIKFNPLQLTLIDISEENLFKLQMTINEILPKNTFKYVIADVKELDILDEIFTESKPEIVLHAAAYKHVPLMEENPLQAVKTNILGTLNIGQTAVKHAVERFVLVSTDKAVNPTNIMGASKRIAEIICQDLQLNSLATKFLTVRFGNVLGSSGSVIPTFKQQILKGGPITVTHPEIQRYFMSIPEAAQLILQAGAIGTGGEIFVLDMGEPIKIIDIAKQLIKLAHLKLDSEIEIKFIGLRPGEKLFEELLADKEKTLPTSHPLVRVAQSTTPTKKIIEKIHRLLVMKTMSKNQLISYLIEIIPEYDPEQNQNKVFSDRMRVLDHVH